MATVVVRTPNEFEARLQAYIFERSEEARAVRVGEKEASEQAAIVDCHYLYPSAFVSFGSEAGRPESIRGEASNRMQMLLNGRFGP